MNDVMRSENTNYLALLDAIEKRIDSGVEEAAKALVKSQLGTYWDTGRYIVEYEQNGVVHAEYGMELLKKLAKDLSLRKGKGYSRPNLYNMRRFYLTYPDGYTALQQLTWSHICELIRIENELEREFYTKECIAEKWDVRTLRRQKNSSLFLRLAASTNKEGILALANEGITIEDPSDVIKDTYTLEFLNVDGMEPSEESELEQRIIRHLQEFLLELGKGFTFEREQYPMRINNRTYHCDLVFYHRILKRFFLFDLKMEAVQHEDVGQMNMYMGYFAEEINEPDDNPPVGVILAREKDELMVKYATYGMDPNLFVSKYELYLPNEAELRKLVDGILNENVVDEEESV